MPTKKCIEFCGEDCNGDHHVILTSLNRVNCQDTLQQFRQLLRAYHIHGFQLNESVPDPHPDFRYPLLHWAVVLKKADVVRLLLAPPFSVSATIKSGESEETALHRILNRMDDGKANLTLILEMVDLLRECLTIPDAETKTPFHICADILRQTQKRELKLWKIVFQTMLERLDNDVDKAEVLNKKDNDGETVLHILSKREEAVDLLEYLICIGGKYDIENNAGETPVEISWRFSLVVYNFYQMFMQAHEKNDDNASSSIECEYITVDDKSTEKRTRTSLGLSETKDYTKFFDENLSSNESDNDDKDYALSPDDEEIDEDDENDNSCLQRRFDKMKVSLSCCSEELSSSNQSPPRIRTRSTARENAKKRRMINSDSSAAEENERNYSVRAVKPKKMARKSAQKFKFEDPVEVNEPTKSMDMSEQEIREGTTHKKQFYPMTSDNQIPNDTTHYLGGWPKYLGLKSFRQTSCKSSKYLTPQINKDKLHQCSEGNETKIARSINVLSESLGQESTTNINIINKRELMYTSQQTNNIHTLNLTQSAKPNHKSTVNKNEQISNNESIISIPYNIHTKHLVSNTGQCTRKMIGNVKQGNATYQNNIKTERIENDERQCTLYAHDHQISGLKDIRNEAHMESVNDVKETIASKIPDIKHRLSKHACTRSAEELKERIINTIEAIKELFDDEDIEDDDTICQGDKGETKILNDQMLARMTQREIHLDKKIDIIQTAINKIASM